jgi:nucleotide-binding universal stress UspA family protein
MAPAADAQAQHKPTEAVMYQSVLVPLDGSDLAECVLPHVESVAGSPATTVTFLRALVPVRVAIPGGDYFMSTAEIDRLQNRHEQDARDYFSRLNDRLQHLEAHKNFEVITGHAAEAIVEYTTRSSIDLIVMATHGRSGIRRWVMGSVAERVLHWSCTPILMVRPPQCYPSF